MSPSPTPAAPGLRRRLACLVYEGLILFGLLLLPGALGALMVATIGQAPPAVLGTASVVLFGAYFVGFWSTRGQTLPMQTWHIRVQALDGQLPGRGRALARYLAAYAWVAPGALLAAINGWHGKALFSALAVGAAAYALLALLHPQRQFWHDALCGTRLVDARASRTPG